MKAISLIKNPENNARRSPSLLARGAEVTQVAKGGFTLIELLVVMAIIATLLSIAAPRYFHHVDRAKEATLRESLNVMRDAIDKFHADTNRYPAKLDDLVTKHYLRKVPIDPITDRDDGWVELPPPSSSVSSSSQQSRDEIGPASGGVYDVRSGAPGNGLDGTPYDEY